jgi:hypothetical protein
MLSRSHGITIDTLKSIAREDALWVSRDQNGQYCVSIFICNVAAYISLNSPADKYAKRVGQSLYQPSAQSRPMIPFNLRPIDFSLQPNETRNVIAVHIYLNSEFLVNHTTVKEAELTSLSALNFAAVNNILSNKEGLYQCSDKTIEQVVTLSAEVAEGLYSLRAKTGKKEKKTNFTASSMLTELLMLANSELARFMRINNQPCLFRNQGTQMNNPTGRGSSEFSDQCKGHQDLNLDCYGFYTSPLRRYADLANQHALLCYIRGSTNPDIDYKSLADHLNRLEISNKGHGRDEYYRKQGIFQLELRVRKSGVERLHNGDLRRLLSGANGWDMHRMTCQEVLKRFKTKIMTKVVAEIVISGKAPPEDLAIEFDTCARTQHCHFGKYLISYFNDLGQPYVEVIKNEVFIKARHGNIFSYKIDGEFDIAEKDIAGLRLFSHYLGLTAP